MKKRILAVAAVIFSSLQVFAQSPSTISEQTLEEAIITAQKYPGRATTTGKVMIIITKDDIEKSGARDLAQLLSAQTGLVINGANSNPGKDKSVYLRGARAEHTLITIDGIPVYDPSGIGGHFDIRNLSISNIERIEILKGSQSTLYGSDAIAGVINIITKPAFNQTLRVDAGTSYGSFESFKGNAGIQGKKNKLDYQASYAYHVTSGINEAVDRSFTTPVDKDGFEQHSLQLGLGIKALKNISIQPFFRYGASNGAIDDGAFADELDNDFTQKSLQAGVRNEVSIMQARLTVLYNYNKSDRLYIDDSVLSRNGFDVYSRASYQGYEHLADAYIVIPVNDAWKFTGGMDYRNARTDQFYTSLGAFPFTEEYGKDSLVHSQYSIYSTLNWSQGSKNKSGSFNYFNLEFGGRLNVHSDYGAHPVFSINPSYFIDQKWKLFANLSSGYRTPSLYQLFSFFGNEDLQPESSISVEGGVQFFSTHNRFNGRLVAFSRNVKDLIFFYTDPTTFRSQYINQDRQKDHGLELELSLKPVSNLQLRGHYTFTKGKYETKTGGKDTSYNNLLRRPESAFGLHLSYQVTPNFLVSANGQYFGKRKDAYFDPAIYTTVYTTLDAYFLADLYLEYTIKKGLFRFFADLRNITDSKYTEISGFNTNPLSGYAGVRVRFLRKTDDR